MKAEAVARYLSYRLPEAEGLRLVELRRMFPGISRETWLVDVEWGQDRQKAHRGFTFRLDTPGGSIAPIPLSFEYEVYRRLQGTSVPVAKVLWYERDPQWLMDGREFYVREKVEGATYIPNLDNRDPQYNELRIAVAKEHTEKLALIHTLDWRKQGFGEIMPVPNDETDCARLDLEIWEEIFERTRPEPFPAMAKVVSWLKEHQPERAPRICLVKGNNGIGEEIWQGTKIIAMSDWEFAHLGDPAEDWAWTQGITPLWEIEKLLEHYEKASGIHIAPENLTYYYAYRSFKAFISLQSGARMFINGKDLRAQVASLSLGAYQSQKMLADLAGI